MQRIDYLDNDFTKKAWSAIDNSDFIEITISKNLAVRAEKALDYYMQYCELRKNRAKRWRLLMKFAWFGTWTPSLWGVINHAELHGLKINSWGFEQHQLIIRIGR